MSEKIDMTSIAYKNMQQIIIGMNVHMLVYMERLARPMLKIT